MTLFYMNYPILISDFGFGVVFVLLLGYVGIYLVPTKHTNYAGPVIGLLSVCLTCILTLYINTILVEDVLPLFGQHIKVNNLTYQARQTYAFKKKLITYIIFFSTCPIFQIFILLIMATPILFLYSLLSENRFSDDKLGPITFLLCEAIAFLVLGSYAEYSLVGKLAPFYKLVLIFLVLLFLAFFTNHLWELEHQAKKKKTEDLLKSRKLQ